MARRRKNKKRVRQGNTINEYRRRSEKIPSYYPLKTYYHNGSFVYGHVRPYDRNRSRFHSEISRYYESARMPITIDDYSPSNKYRDSIFAEQIIDRKIKNCKRSKSARRHYAFRAMANGKNINHYSIRKHSCA